MALRAADSHKDALHAPRRINNLDRVFNGAVAEGAPVLARVFNGADLLIVW